MESMATPAPQTSMKDTKGICMSVVKTMFFLQQEALPLLTDQIGSRAIRSLLVVNKLSLITNPRHIRVCVLQFP